MGWVFALIFAAIAGSLLWRFARLPPAGAELIAAAALLAVAGYVWQGSPSAAGAPVAAADEGLRPEDTAAIAARREMSGQFGSDNQVIEFADTLDRLGLTQNAVTAVRTALIKHPNSVDLWVALGNTLVVHGKGLVSPAAEYAFGRAAQLSPQHPAPPYFLGLARANAGQTEEAARLWRDLLARTPKEAGWRAELEARLAAVTALQPSPAPTPPG